MILSVIIVNYQVKYFLELCLRSVQKTLQGLDAEIIVVDNHSSDGSIGYLRPLFPGVRWIANTENTGFARANNQALQQAQGKYILFLNPDTILPEDGAARCLEFLESTPYAGGLGVRMIDGSGHFLKESRRGFPSPWVAFCKMSGLTALFPGWRPFALYYLGHLPAHRTHPAPVLSGACFWVARAVLEKTGGFDERFFMYAEDIDLSYRIEQAGYRNYYFAGTTIVHFKGESTQKDTRYVRLFYKAMSQFRKKHFRRGLPALSNWGIEGAIWLRASLGALRRIAGPRRSAAKSTTGSSQPKVFLKGDPAAAQHLQASPEFSKACITVIDRGEAEELILCQGERFSFKDCITALEEAREQTLKVRFYAEGSGSVVGSTSRDGQGEAIVVAPHH